MFVFHVVILLLYVLEPRINTYMLYSVSDLVRRVGTGTVCLLCLLILL